MYICDQSKKLKNGKFYRRVLLRSSYRDASGKSCHDTIANLSSCSDNEIAAIKLALKHKCNLSKLQNIKKNLVAEQGLSVGAIWLLNKISGKLGIKKALGNSQQAKLIEWLIFASLINQGSRLSAVRLAKQHAVCDVLKIENGFCEDTLYRAMDWLAPLQNRVENALFKFKYKGNKIPTFYLYDVTSSYLEGCQNELANFGYNRDKKRGKMQIVIGLMTDEDGHPIAIEVFEGNTNDTKTVNNQIQKIAKRFGVENVTLIGDRGMIKRKQINTLNDDYDFNYITAISKPEIEKMVKDEVIQYGLFDTEIVEIEYKKVRYFLRRNPIRAEEIEITRQQKLAKIKTFIKEQNQYLIDHPRAKVKTAENKINAKIAKLKIEKWAKIKSENRKIEIEIDEKQEQEIRKYDGCYVIKTDLSKQEISAQKAHDRYKELAHVENAFRTLKTGLLEIRPIFTRKDNRTRAHVFIKMLAYMIEHELRQNWSKIDTTVEEGIAELSSICGMKITIPAEASYQTIPKPRKLGKSLLEAAKIRLPAIIPSANANVHTRKKVVIPS